SGIGDSGGECVIADCKRPRREERGTGEASVVDLVLALKPRQRQIKGAVLALHNQSALLCQRVPFDALAKQRGANAFGFGLDDLTRSLRLMGDDCWRVSPQYAGLMRCDFG